jgi:hypothetical protein
MITATSQIERERRETNGAEGERRGGEVGD